MAKEYRPALRHLDSFSHALVLWWCHHADADDYRALLEVSPPYKCSPSPLGTFATRSPARPNPLAISTVAIAEIDRATGLVKTPYLDAADETPILDLKPYHPSLDRVRDVAVPGWCDHWPKRVEDSESFDWSAELAMAGTRPRVLGPADS